MQIRFYKLGRLFKNKGLINRERTASWAVALAQVIYHLGASYRHTAQILAGFNVQVSQVAISMRTQAQKQVDHLGGSLAPSVDRG